jgi:hypothetical protein
MSELKERILDRLQYGKANAITGKQLANSFGFKDDRVIREEIRKLIARLI